jgi:hypothetical protein
MAGERTSTGNRGEVYLTELKKIGNILPGDT